MNPLRGNPHIEDAMTYSCAASEIMAHEDQERALYAQQATTHATLALAYEQRTANLIALMSHADSDQYETIWRAMTERLGLSEENTDG